LLLDAMKGDATLFTRNDEIEEAWSLLAPLFDAWGSDRAPQLYNYEAGSWGPAEAAALLRKRGHTWRRL
jgi:glucose-6-phosphate 1-dehydrogenase